MAWKLSFLEASSTWIKPQGCSACPIQPRKASQRYLETQIAHRMGQKWSHAREAGHILSRRRCGQVLEPEDLGAGLGL